MSALKTVGQFLVLLAGLTALYRTYRRWRTYKAVRKLAGKVILITGASGGLGEAIVRVLHSVGVKVILAGRDIHKLQQIKFTLDSETPGNGTAVRHSPAILELDLTEGHTIVDRAHSALNLFGHIDVLINNAGVSSRGSVLETDIRVDRTIMETNFFGPIQLTKALLPSMLERGCGQIVVISSIQGKMGLPLRSSYSASKHALHGYFDSLRVEVAPRGISVTLVCLGYVQTRLSVNALRGDGSQHGVTEGTTAKGMSVEKAAYKTIESFSLHKRECVLAKPIHQIALYINMLCPELIDWILRKRAKVN